MPHLERANNRYLQATERLASGQRINHPYDDAAGLSRATLLESEIRSAAQAQNNAGQGLAIIQIAEGGMQQAGNILMRMRELAVQGSNEATSDQERQLLGIELGQLSEELDRLANTVRYADSPLLNGQGRDYVFQVGTGNTEYDRVSFNTSSVDARADSLGVRGLSVSDSSSSQSSIDAISNAIHQVQNSRALLGAMQTRFHFVADQLKSYEMNVTSMHSMVMDADVAKETTELLSSEIQQRSAIAVMAQANIYPRLALKLIEMGMM